MSIKKKPRQGPQADSRRGLSRVTHHLSRDQGRFPAGEMNICDLRCPIKHLVVRSCSRPPRNLSRISLFVGSRAESGASGFRLSCTTNGQTNERTNGQAWLHPGLPSALRKIVVHKQRKVDKSTHGTGSRRGIARVGGLKTHHRATWEPPISYTRAYIFRLSRVRYAPVRMCVCVCVCARARKKQLSRHLHTRVHTYIHTHTHTHMSTRVTNAREHATHKRLSGR